MRVKSSTRHRSQIHATLQTRPSRIALAVSVMLLGFGNPAWATAFTYDNNDTLGSTITINSGDSVTYINNSTVKAAIINVQASGDLFFKNNAKAGTATIKNVDDAITTFSNKSSADEATINNDDGVTNFEDTATAGSATINNFNEGVTTFYADSLGEEATINNDGGLSITYFLNQSSAEKAAINNVNFGSAQFFNSSNAGSAKISNKTNGITYFANFSSALDATIDNDAGGTAYFDESSTAGNAKINNFGPGGVGASFGGTEFAEDSSAGTATITNWKNGLTVFNDESTASNATINNEIDGKTVFRNSSTAGNATINNKNNGETSFNDTSSAGNATIHNTDTGSTLFNDNSNAGSAKLIADGGGTFFAFNGTRGSLNDNQVSAGSIEGSGSFIIGKHNTFTVGSNNASTTVSGVIEDGADLVGMPGGSGGNLVKVGTGTLTLTGVNTYTGTTTINGGTLIVDDLTTTTSQTTVKSGGTLGGFGIIGSTLGDTIVESGGVIAPGNSGSPISTLGIRGNVQFNAGSIFRVQIDDAGNSDWLFVADNDAGIANGVANINGGTVQVLAGAGNYAASTLYTILTADDGVSGEFDAVTSNFIFLTPTLSYDFNNVYLTMTRNANAFASIAGTPNEQHAAAGAESLGAGNPVVDAILGLTTLPEALAAFDALSGEIHASTQSTLIEDSRFLQNTTLNRLRDAGGGVKLPVRVAQVGGWPEMGAERSPVFWSHVFGSWGRLDGDRNAAEVRRDIGGVFVGADTAVAENARIGFVGGYSRSDFDVGGGRRSSGESDNYSLGVYGGANWGNLALRSGAAYTRHNVDTRRHVTIGAFTDNLKADYDANTTQVYAELGYAIPHDDVTLEPFANLAYVNVDTDGFREKGGAAALRVKGSDADVVFTTLGAHVSGVAFGKASYKGTLGWRHMFGDRTPDTTMNFVSGGSAFSIAGAPLERDSAVISAGLDFAISDNANLGVSYTGQFGKDIYDHGARVGLSVKF
ncbi:MAG: autotransporter domain-containing protein [Methylobacillus sp.]|nr:autotransporter domain-containing protein [Methylobacillus sp.]